MGIYSLIYIKINCAREVKIEKKHNIVLTYNTKCSII